MIAKNKTMLQIPVKKEIAEAFNGIVKEFAISKETLFQLCFTEFLLSCSKKGEEKHGKKGKQGSKA